LAYVQRRHNIRFYAIFCVTQLSSSSSAIIFLRHKRMRLQQRNVYHSKEMLSFYLVFHCPAVSREVDLAGLGLRGRSRVHRVGDPVGGVRHAVVDAGLESMSRISFDRTQFLDDT
jgi:hypothetical protein